MRRLTVLIAVCVLFLGFTVSTSGRSFAAGILNGTVTDAVTTLPIGGASVQTFGPSNQATSTDIDGVYNFPSLPAGSYDVTASVFGYLSATVAGVSVVDDTTTVQDYALTPAPTHILQGTVIDADTALPIGGVTVQITGTPIPPTTTDNTGGYNFPSVPEGSYNVVASKICYLSATASVVINADTTQDFVLPHLEDTTPPVINVIVNPDKLWPPNHKYKTVIATVEVSDDMDPNPTVTLVSVTSNEPDNAKGDGNTINDIVIVNDYTFKLRAERSGSGNGRVYTITYRAVDACGNISTGTATVTVPKSMAN
jgi:hypothetical protein